VHVALKNHLPEVCHRLRKRPLAGDVESLLVTDGGRNMTGVDVSAFVFLTEIYKKWLKNV
jgi:hypothetical protein